MAQTLEDRTVTCLASMTICLVKLAEEAYLNQSVYFRILSERKVLDFDYGIHSVIK